MGCRASSRVRIPPFPPSNPLIFNGFFGFWGPQLRINCGIRKTRVRDRPLLWTYFSHHPTAEFCVPTAEFLALKSMAQPVSLQFTTTMACPHLMKGASMKTLAILLLCASSAVLAQTTYTPNPFGGGGTFHGPGGTTTYTPNPFGGGGTYSGPSGTTTYTPNPFGGGGTFNGPGGTTTYTPNPFGGGGTFNAPGGTTTYTPNPFGGGGTFNGPSGTTTYTPNPFGGGGTYSR